jgi:cation transport ATPase
MRSTREKVVGIAGFAYGLVMAFYAIGWGVDGPTLTMPLAASPLNVPAAVLDTASLSIFLPLMPVFIIGPILAAPFCWSAMALFARNAQSVRYRMIVAAVLVAHYIGVGVWFVLEGESHLLRPFRILRSEGAMLLGFYAAGQVLIWWALLRHRSISNHLASRRFPLRQFYR